MHQFFQSVLVPGLADGAIYGLVAVAFATLFSTTGVINFAHGQLVMLMPMAILVAVGAGLPAWLAYVAALVVLIAVALTVEWAAVRPFVQSGQSVSWLLSTLGVSVVLAEVLAVPYGGEARNFKHGISAHRFDLIGGLRIAPAELAAVAALFVVAGLLAAFYRRTRIGLELRAIADDLDGAEAIGISRARASQLAMVLSALVAAVTGVLVASTQPVTPSLGLSYTFYGFVATAMGGMGSIGGALVGGLVVGVATQAAGVYVGSLVVNVAVFLLLLAVYLVRPHGFFGAAPVRAV
ncbi:branched-chain amino acid ABC transporter permease [Dactylosporangium sucinum]|uniref:Branched-chain amino acid ABC transporter permease n=1 Tax=Dactylosporangium sucinum TaxID=1424081 RepID=A0A917WYF3_9ACTN|nr:branched-chain amino acid ABC transporter permease [Dactylosporangium sucinum]GGM40997.1 branched-chain amino acid ABC transporter permease [Dactylosporangium sucinum]